MAGIESELEWAWEYFINKICDIEQSQWDGTHEEFLRIVRKQFGTETQEAYIDWWGED